MSSSPRRRRTVSRRTRKDRTAASHADPTPFFHEGTVRDARVEWIYRLWWPGERPTRAGYVLHTCALTGRSFETREGAPVPHLLYDVYDAAGLHVGVDGLPFTLCLHPDLAGETPASRRALVRALREQEETLLELAQDMLMMAEHLAQLAAGLRSR